MTVLTKSIPHHQPMTVLSQIYLEMWEKFVANGPDTIIKKIHGSQASNENSNIFLNVGASFMVFMGTERGIEFTAHAVRNLSSSYSRTGAFLSSWAVKNMPDHNGIRNTHIMFADVYGLDKLDPSEQAGHMTEYSGAHIDVADQMVLFWATPMGLQWREAAKAAMEARKAANELRELLEAKED